MADPADLNSLYQQWLEIPAERCPPNHYALLGVNDFEEDLATIEKAAKERGAYLHQIAAGPNRKTVQEMLGQVAVARRVLLNEASKSDYDQSLSQPATAPPLSDPTPIPEQTPVKNQPVAPTSGTPQNEASPTADANETEKATSRPATAKRKKKSDLKYHLASAAALLALVGLIAFLNSGQGGRQASQVQETTSASGAKREKPSPASKSTEESSNAAFQSASQPAPAAARKATPKAAKKARPEAARKRPTIEKTERPSGLVSAMPAGAATDFSNLTPKTNGGPNFFQPFGGVTKGSLRKRVSAKDWPTGLVKAAAFETNIQSHFDCEQGFEWLVAEEGHWNVAPKMKSSARLVSKDIQLQPGESVSITTSMAQRMNSELRLGIELGNVRVGIKPSKRGVNVFVKEIGGSEESITTLKSPKKPITLLVQRHPTNLNRVHWMARSGEQFLAGQNIEGQIGDQRALVAISVTGPKKPMKTKFWIRGWMVPGTDSDASEPAG